MNGALGCKLFSLQKYFLHRIALLFLLGCVQASADTLIIPGSGAVEVLLKALAESFNQSQNTHTVEVPSSIGSSGGIKAVLAGDAMLARVARPLKPDEANLTYKPFARDAIVFVAGAQAGVSALSTEQLIDIFSGRLRNWQLLGGIQAPIRLLTRESTETSLVIMKQHLAAFRTLTFSPQAKLANRDFEMLELLDKYPTGIGWLTRSTVAAAASALKVITLDGVEPNLDNILSGAYSLVGEYAFVYRPGQLTAAAEQFMNFIDSETGRAVLEKRGVTPSE